MPHCLTDDTQYVVQFFKQLWQYDEIIINQIGGHTSELKEDKI